VKWLIDVCAGVSLAEWLGSAGEDVRNVRDRSATMDDDEILAWAHAEDRVVVTIDKDFGRLAVALGQSHCGIVRLPDVPAAARQHLMAQVLTRHRMDLTGHAIITVSTARIRVRYP